jgi:hypothetical protein
MENSNGPPRGANVTADQSSYDLIFKDIILNSQLGTYNGSSSTNASTTQWSYNLQNDSFNNVYKVQLISAAIVFASALPSGGSPGVPNIRNQSIILQIPQLNGNTVKIAGNVSNSNSQQGTNSVQSLIFCQIPDNNTPLGNANSNNTISMYANSAFYDSIQFYNPPISKVNKIDVQWTDQYGTIVTGNYFTSWYCTIRVYYLQKRNNTSAISVPTFTISGTGTLDSIYQPSH